MIKILMIDDHPSQIEGYKTILSYYDGGIPITTTAVYDCESAYNAIMDSVPAAYDLIFLDRSLPPYKEKDIKSGEDLALLIRQRMPGTRIVMLTSHAEAFMLYQIAKTIAPEGLLVKSDFGGDDLLTAFDQILKGHTYYSQTVAESLKELASREHYLDHYNRQIIILLSQGIKTKNIHEHLNLSQSAVEKRKALIKEYLNIEKGSDEDIVKEAKRLGYI